MAFNTHGWLKADLSDVASDSCDLYVKNATDAQPEPDPPAAPDPISFWPLPVSVAYGEALQPVASGLTFTLSPAHAGLQAYADRLGAETFAATSPSAEPKSGATANVNVVVADADAPLALGVGRVVHPRLPRGRVRRHHHGAHGLWCHDPEPGGALRL